MSSTDPKCVLVVDGDPTIVGDILILRGSRIEDAEDGLQAPEMVAAYDQT